MLLPSWNKLPENMRNELVKPYYEKLVKQKLSLLIKRIFDFVIAGVMVIALSPILLVIALLIKIDSKGPVFFRQTRVTQNCRAFRIFKFRTMVTDAETLGTQVTTNNDSRVTRLGHFLRKYRLDEIPQLFNIITGDMSFVGTRPEVTKYVDAYSPEMLATLLLPAGVTSQCSIEYKDEEHLLADSENADETYVYKILPQKMAINLYSLKRFNLFSDFLTLIATVLAVSGIEMPFFKYSHPQGEAFGDKSWKV